MSLESNFLVLSIFGLLIAVIYLIYTKTKIRPLDFKREKQVTLNMFRDMTNGYGKFWEQFAIPKGNMLTIGVIPIDTKIEGNTDEQKLIVFCLPARYRKEYTDHNFRYSDVHYISDDPSRITDNFRDTEFGQWVIDNAMYSKKALWMEELNAKDRENALKVMMTTDNAYTSQQLIQIQDLFEAVYGNKPEVTKDKKK